MFEGVSAASSKESRAAELAKLPPRSGWRSASSTASATDWRTSTRQ